MKRLLCIVGKMDAGGAETFLMKVYRKLDREKYQMDFAVATLESGIYDTEIVSLGGSIYHIAPKSSGFWKNFSDIKGIVKTNHYNYVIRISQHSLSALELLAAKFGGAKVRVFRSSNSSTSSSSRINMILHKLCMFMPRCFANVRIAPSTEAAEFMFGKGCIKSGKAHLLHNAIDLDYYRFYPEERLHLRESLGIQNKLVIGHVGRFSHQKNHDLSLRVFAKVKEIQPDSVLVLVGKGELEDKIREQAKVLRLTDSIIFMGVRQDVPQLLSAMDAFLFPSLYEGMPNTVIEAQATGLPCVISDFITKEADVTRLVQYKSLHVDTTEWARTLLNLAGKPRMGMEEKLKASGYEITQMVEKFMELIFID